MVAGLVGVLRRVIAGAVLHETHAVVRVVDDQRFLLRLAAVVTVDEVCILAAAETAIPDNLVVEENVALRLDLPAPDTVLISLKVYAETPATLPVSPLDSEVVVLYVEDLETLPASVGVDVAEVE